MSLGRLGCLVCKCSVFLFDMVGWRIICSVMRIWGLTLEVGEFALFFDKMRFGDLRLFKFYQRGVILKTRRIASRKFAERYKFFFVASEIFRERYKFCLEKANKKGTPLRVSLYSTQRYNISRRNANCINICLTLYCSGFVPKPSEVIGLRPGSYCAARRSYQSLCSLEVIASMEVKGG